MPDSSMEEIDDLPLGTEAATSSTTNLSRHGAQGSFPASSSSSSVLMPAFVIDPDSDKLTSSNPLPQSPQSDRSSFRRRGRRRPCTDRFMSWWRKLLIQVYQRIRKVYLRIVYCFVEPPFPVSQILPITDPGYIKKWEHMQHRPTITDLRKGSTPVTITYDDGFTHTHIMVALAQYGWGKAAMIQDETKKTTYELKFMVDPVEYCQHNNTAVSKCIHFKFIIGDAWALSREYFKVSECQGQVTNNFLCLMPSDESSLRPNKGYVW